MTDAPLPADQPARDAIVERLGENMVVEAGAGTGKTRSLVDRVVALVATGRATMDRVAAITFTEAAAAELRERIRQSLERAAIDPTRQPVETERCGKAVADLDQAAVQTLHSFAASLLRERPLEAGLPPGFKTLDEIQADLTFEDEWSNWLDTVLDDPKRQTVLRPALKLGLELSHLRQAALKFHENYDLLTSVSFDALPMPEPYAAQALVEVQSTLRRLLPRAKSPDDLFAHVHSVLTLARRVEEAIPDALEAYRLLARSPTVRCNKGRQNDWDKDPASGENACKLIKETLKALDGQITENLACARTAALEPVLELLRSFALEYARSRKSKGVAQFHDLLVWARDMLRDDLDARDYFRERYSHIFIDETQDTDPLQAQIAMFLAEDAPSGGGQRDRPRDWNSVGPADGKIFVVGDPKQSIYRFRRADVNLVRRVQQIVGGEHVVLSQNFRSRRSIIEWVNHLFERSMQPSEGQPEYIRLDARVDDEAGGDDAPAVRRLGDALDANINIDQVRREEAEAIANTIILSSREGWQVRAEDADAARRPASYRDVCVLIPTRTGLPPLEIALEDAGIPYRLESPSMIYATQELRDMLNCLRAIDDPADQISLVAALRSPAFVCSDLDLLSFVEAGGRFDYLDEPTGPQGPVFEAFTLLREFHARRLWVSPSALIESFVRDRRLLELALDQRHPRERWRRYRFLMDNARTFASAGGSSLRAFLEWTDRQQSEGARVMESPLPELDEEAVRIMTVHGAKGLEFPIVILAGLNIARNARPDAVLFEWTNDKVEAKVGRQGSHFQTSGYDELADVDKQRQDEEFVRLQYVAATRARDHLIVSLYRTAKDKKSAAARIAGFLQGNDHLWPELLVPPTAHADGLASSMETQPVDDDTAEARQIWLEERRQVYQRQSRPGSVAVTRLAQEAKQEQDLPDEPWKRGRAGTSIGRAVHAVLQTVDLKTGGGLDNIARAQAAAEGVPDRTMEISRLARYALSSVPVKRAVDSGRWWREVPVTAPMERGVIEGFIDLLFEEDDGFVIVDYKTDALRSGDEIEKAMQRYRLQAGGYALALNKAIGADIKEVSFLFLHPQREVTIADVPRAMRDAELTALGLLA